MFALITSKLAILIKETQHQKILSQSGFLQPVMQLVDSAAKTLATDCNPLHPKDAATTFLLGVLAKAVPVAQLEVPE